MKLNKKIELGIKAVQILKSSAGVVKSSDLASKVGTTTVFMEQIMRSLRLEGLVAVKRGPGGGYFINPNIVQDRLSAYHVAAAFGKFSAVLDLDDTGPANRLQLAISEAYSNTLI